MRLALRGQGTGLGPNCSASNRRVPHALHGSKVQFVPAKAWRWESIKGHCSKTRVTWQGRGRGRILAALRAFGDDNPEGPQEGEGAGKAEVEQPTLQYSEPPERIFQLSELLSFAGYDELSQMIRENYGDYKIKGLQNDVEKVVEGDVFFCEVAEDEEDLSRAVEAVDKGAATVVVQSEEESVLCCEDKPLICTEDILEAEAKLAVVFYGNPSGNMLMAGVTGSDGKTTVCWLLRSIFEHCGLITGFLGDIEYSVAHDPLDVEGNLWKPSEPDPTEKRRCTAPYHLAPYRGKYHVKETLPDLLKIQKVLAGMSDRGAKACVMECPSTTLDLYKCHFVYYALAIFTNLVPTQLDDHETVDQYIEAKAQLFKELDNPEKQRAIINIDDDYAARFLEFAKNVPVVTYGIKDHNADVWVESVKYTIWETELVIRTPVGQLEVISYLIGEYNVYNVLAAVAAALSVNAPLGKIAEGLEAVEYVPGRTQVIDIGSHQLFSVVVDNASTPQRLARLLDMIRLCGPRRIFLVFGCKGDTDKSHRAEMGHVAHVKSDHVIITNDCPRYDAPDEIMGDVMDGLPEEIRERYALWVFSPWQDPARIPWWFEDWLHQAQRDNQRYIIEDRFFAIRAAIGTAQEGDVVVIAGKGDENFQEFANAEGSLDRGWFDDRTEAADALTKLEYLLSAGLDRKEIPWQRAKAETT